MFVDSVSEAPAGPLDRDWESENEAMEALLARRRTLDALEAEWLGDLAVFDRDQVADYDGYRSTAAFLADRAQVGTGTASRMVRTARTADLIPRIFAAAVAGVVSRGQLQVAADVCRRFPDLSPVLEDRFLEYAAENNLKELRQQLECMIYDLIGEAYFSEREAQGPDQYLLMGSDQTRPGMVWLRGLLSTENAETISTAVNTLARSYHQAAPVEGRPLGYGQAQAQALTDICSQYLSRSDRPTQGGERPHLTVTVNYETLLAHSNSHPLGSDTGYPPPVFASGNLALWSTVEQIACDATVCRIVLSPQGLPLDVGRATRTIPPAIRTAVVHRDRGCRFPGCDRPASACDCHHIIYWTHYGPTAVWNLILLCARHHRAIHQDGYRIRHDRQGGLNYYRPDGTLLAHQPAAVGTPKLYRQYKPARAPAG